MNRPLEILKQNETLPLNSVSMSIDDSLKQTSHSLNTTTEPQLDSQKHSSREHNSSMKIYMKELGAIPLLTPEQEIEFAITSLDRLLDNPQKLSLGYQFKMSKIHVFLDSVDPDRIPLKFVPTLFKAL